MVGTSPGGMWALCLAVDAPDRVAALASLGVPPSRCPACTATRSSPRSPHPACASSPRGSARRTSRRHAGRWPAAPSGLAPPSERPTGFFEVVHEGMRQPGIRTAMLSHMWLAMRLGRPRPENLLSEAERRQLTVPVLMIWGDDDPYGGPEIGQRACALIPDARLEVIPGRHAPFLDDPERCGALIDELLRRATMT
ncbi:MAG TPA: alpha/beta hydrolase [Solirubrobacteraceae bacterium]|nr:alpha/beta hydrolase [Solirubrobacteraceae bacterium]